MEITGNDSENKATNTTGNRRKCRRNTKPADDHQNHGAHQRGHRINIRLQDARNVRGENVAAGAATHSRDGAEKRGHERMDLVVDGFFGTGYGEKREAGRV